MSQFSVSAASPAPVASSSSSPSANKRRSCVVCRSRKVRCDKQSPCSNCRRANIECVVPSNDRPPRWAQRLERLTNAPTISHRAVPPPATAGSRAAKPATEQVIERLRNLEGLVKELSGQLEQANAAASSTTGGSSRGNSPAHGRAATTNTSGVQENLGRLVLQDTDRPHYISSGFWSRVSDELDGLDMDTKGLASGDSEISDDEDLPPGETPSTQETGRTPSERHGFLFRHHLRADAPDLREFSPLPSQIPFLLDIFSENVNFFLQIVHMPTVTKMVRGIRGADMSNPSPANEALLFSIYYSAVTSMEDEDVLSNFGSTKAELNLRYRLGLEHALSKADFMSSPNLVLVQAFTIFLFLARLHDKPMSVWMMTGLVIRMAHAIGLHRDGSHFAHLSPFEVEMRRRVWWAVCMLDTRASEDQGTDYSITAGTYDTKLPLNINDADIDPETKEPPPERQALTDMTISLVTHEMCGKARQMTGREAKEGAANLDERSRAITALFEHLQILYLQYATESGNIACWVAVTATRLVMCKLTLYVYLPSLFSSPNESFSEEIRNKLLVAAIELAEYNHILNSERNARHWRWTFQTYTHWHAIVYLLIECSRRQWSPTLERAWIALHSHWLIPKKSPSMDRKSQIWVPLRKLMAKARKHRTAELKRLRGNMQAVEQLEMADINIPAPESSMTFSTENSRDLSLRHWRSLVNVSADQGTAGLTAGPGDPRISNSLSVRESIHTPPQHPGFVLSVGKPRSWPNASFESGYPNTGSYVGGNSLANASVNPNAIMGTNSQSALEGKPADPAEWPLMDPGSSGWLWADTDPMVDVFGDVDVDINMDIAGDIDWNSWVQSAAGMEMNACPPGSNGGVYERQYLI